MTQRGYKLKLLDSTMSTLSTYAEILTKRFGTHTTVSPKGDDDRSKSSKSFPTPQQIHGSNARSNGINTDGTRRIPKASEAEDKPPSTKTPTPITSSNSNKGTETNQINQWNMKLAAMERKLDTQMDQFEQRNRSTMSTLEQRIEEQMDQLESTIEQKMMDISNVVVSRVTFRLTKVIEKMFKKPSTEETGPMDISKDTTITQESPPLYSSHDEPLLSRTPNSARDDRAQKCTNQMLQELQKIETDTNYKLNDPSHDNNIIGLRQLPS